MQVTKPSSGFLGFHLNPFFFCFFFFFCLKNKNLWIYCYSLWYVLDLSEAKNAVVFLQSFELRQKNKTFCVFRSGFDSISHPVAWIETLEMSILPKGDSIQIREVWNDNLEEEFSLIREVVDNYNFIAMDTEFPGVVLRPVGTFKNINDYNYQTLKDNVDMLKLIQLGLTFSDENGNLPTCGTDKFCIWQFNFREFNISEDIFASDSIELLHQCGIDFKKNNEKGIDVNRFGELLMSSGIVLNDGVQWVTFHSGYDFGYLLKLLTCRSLPDTQAGFFDLINMYFPTVYDIKHLMKFCNSLHGGLNKLAELLDVERVGVCHQAGSDSLLTASTFRKLRETFFSGSTEKYAGVLYGLGVENGQSTNWKEIIGDKKDWWIFVDYLSVRLSVLFVNWQKIVNLVVTLSSLLAL